MGPEAPFDFAKVRGALPPERRGGAPVGLRLAVSVLAALAATGGVGIALEHLRPSWFSGLRAGGAATSTSLPGGTTTTLATRPSTTLPAGPGPAIASLQPSSGSAGQTVTITGRGFHSADQQIQVYFGSSAAVDRCPTETTCTAVVPPGKAGSAVSVSLRTQAGTSNVVTFRYH